MLLSHLRKYNNNSLITPNILIFPNHSPNVCLQSVVFSRVQIRPTRWHSFAVPLGSYSRQQLLSCQHTHTYAIFLPHHWRVEKMAQVYCQMSTFWMSLLASLWCHLTSSSILCYFLKTAKLNPESWLNLGSNFLVKYLIMMQCIPNAWHWRHNVLSSHF